MTIDDLIRLSQEHIILPFTCGDIDLENFLNDDAKAHCEALLSVTYIIERGDVTVAFFSLFNDKISLATKWALIIPIFYEDERRILWALRMVCA